MGYLNINFEIIRSSAIEVILRSIGLLGHTNGSKTIKLKNMCAICHSQHIATSTNHHQVKPTVRNDAICKLVIFIFLVLAHQQWEE